MKKKEILNKEDRKKLAVRLASYLWFLSQSIKHDGSSERDKPGAAEEEEKIIRNKEAIISATADSFLKDKNWPSNETTVPPKEFEG